MTDNSDINFLSGGNKKTGFLHRISGKSQFRRDDDHDHFAFAENVVVNAVKTSATTFDVTEKSVVDEQPSGALHTPELISDIAFQENSGEKIGNGAENDLDIQITIKKMLEVSSNMMCVVKNDIIFMLNKAAGRLLGVDDVNDYCGRSFSSLVIEKDRYAFKNITGIIDNRREILTKVIKSNGGETDCLIRGGYLKRDDTSMYVLEIRTVGESERLKTIKAMDASVLYDNLTGASSEVLFADRLKHSIAKDTNPMYQRPVFPVKLTVMAINVSDVNGISQVYGPEAASFMIKTLIERINKECKRAASVCRSGYDTLFLAFENIGDVSEAEREAKNLLTVLKEPVLYEYDRLAVDARIGIAVYPLHHLNADDLINSAEKCSLSVKGTDQYIKVYETRF